MLQRDCASILQETLGLSGFSSCGTWAQRLCSMWDLPAPGIEPMSPALTGRFFITEPLGKPKGWVLSQLFYSLLSSSSRGSLNPLHFAIRVVSSAYLKVLIFLLAIFIPICFIQPCISHDVQCINDTLCMRCESCSLCPIHATHGLYSPWNSPGQNTGVRSHSLLQGIFPTQGLNAGLLCLLNCRQIIYHLSHQGSSKGLEIRYKFNITNIRILKILKV